MARAVLKYPGSKWNIAKQITSVIPTHHSYVEPFFGSGAVLFNKEPSDIETINDLDGDVVNLFSCIRADSERLAAMTLATPFARDVYNKTFSQESADPYEKAAAFLIKCWQGHGFRTNGYKVGWKNDVQGRERMYALWNWYRLPEWIIDIAERLRTVQIENKPATEVIQRFNYENVCMYLDPPYLLSTRSGKQYKHEMDDEGHIELLKTISESKAKIIISGYASDLYETYLADWYRKKIPSCAEYGKVREEILWMNFTPNTDKQLMLEF